MAKFKAGDRVLIHNRITGTVAGKYTAHKQVYYAVVLDRGDYFQHDPLCFVSTIVCHPNNLSTTK